MNIKGEFSNWLYKRDIGFLMSEQDVDALPDFDMNQDIDDPSGGAQKAKKEKEDARRRGMSDEAQRQQQKAQQQPQQSQSQSPQWHPPQPYSPPKPESRLKPKSDALSKLEKYRDDITKQANSANTQTPAQLASRQPTQTNRGNSLSPSTRTPSSTNQSPYEQSQSQSQSSNIRSSSQILQDPWKE
jgi:hypothetical protein